MALARALWLSFRLRQGNSRKMAVARLGAAAVMAVAIAGMHYTGMAAAGFSAHAFCFSGVEFSGPWTAAGITAAALAVLLLTLLSAQYETHLQLSRLEHTKDIEQAHADLRHQHMHDALTRLPNRDLFMIRLGQAVQDAHLRQRLLAVLVLDLDRFKVINDAIGHDAGNALLVDAAGRLSRCMGPEDTLARPGGDEFLVLLSDIGTIEDVALLEARLLTSMREPFRISQREYYTTLSIGASLYPLHATDGEELVSQPRRIYVCGEALRPRHAAVLQPGSARVHRRTFAT